MKRALAGVACFAVGATVGAVATYLDRQGEIAYLKRHAAAVRSARDDWQGVAMKWKDVADAAERRVRELDTPRPARRGW